MELTITFFLIVLWMAIGSVVVGVLMWQMGSKMVSDLFLQTILVFAWPLTLIIVFVEFINNREDKLCKWTPWRLVYEFILWIEEKRKRTEN